MKSSLEIAQEAALLPDRRDRRTARAGARRGRAVRPVQGEDLALGAIDRLDDRPDGKLVCVAGMTPTKAGEGKTTTAVSLTQGLGAIGQNPVLCLREPSLGPGVRDQGRRRRRRAGPGRPDGGPQPPLHRRHPRGRRGQQPARGDARRARSCTATRTSIDALRVTWKRAVDMNDRALRDVAIGLGGRPNGYPRESGFDITAASEVMAILAVAARPAGPAQAARCRSRSPTRSTASPSPPRTSAPRAR